MGADGLNQCQARKAIQDSDRERQTGLYLNTAVEPVCVMLVSINRIYSGVHSAKT